TDSPYFYLWENVDPGIYTLTAVAIDNDGASGTSGPVTITVLSNFPPSVAITNPVNYSTFAFPTNFLIAATAQDIDGLIAKVEFFAGGIKIGEATNKPYSLIWTNPPAGEYFLSARATDDLGAGSTSPAVDIFVTQAGGYLSASNSL